MLNIENLIWVVPGALGLWAYRYHRFVNFPAPEGWAYLLAVVFFALPYYFLKFPADFIVDFFNLNKLFAGIIYMLILAISIPLSVKLGVAIAREQYKYSKKVTPDPFYSKCYAWRGKLVFITLKNDKVYLAMLREHTKDNRFEYTISVIPFYSGYRDKQQKIEWTFHYPVKKGIITELIIAQNEIRTFALWLSNEAFPNMPESVAEQEDMKKTVDEQTKKQSSDSYRPPIL